jgi:uncharacterized protein YndB with AHSA1/START domain
MNGELEITDTEARLRFCRQLAHSPEQVWRAITEPEQLAAWFPNRVEGQWTPGAKLRFAFESDDLPVLDGEVLAVEPPRLLEYRWGPDVLRFEIQPTGGGCTLTLIHVFDQVGKAARDAAGWHTCLDALELELGGTPDRSVLSSRWREVHPGYVEAFGPAAATVGPPEQKGQSAG